MKVSIQAMTNEAAIWGEVKPVIHAVDKWEDAVTIAYAISRQLNNTSVRLVSVNSNTPMSQALTVAQQKLVNEHVANLSGTYIQSV